MTSVPLEVKADQFFDLAARDFEEFFRPETKFRLPIEFNGSALARCVGDGDRARLVFATDFKGMDVQSSEDACYLLLILGHELAHYLNRHNSIESNGALEYRALEDWADFYGAKVTAALLRWGSNLARMLAAWRDMANTEKRMCIMSAALSRLAAIYANSAGDSRYSHPINRVGSVVAGMLSFIDTIEGNADLVRSTQVQRWLYSHEGLQELVATDWRIAAADEDSARLSLQQHREIQAKLNEITAGMHDHIARVLYTGFNLSDEEIEAERERRRDLFRKQGMDI